MPMSAIKRKEFVDYYKALDVELGADTATIRRAYLAKAKTYHPDAGGSTAQMQALNTAYRALGDPVARKAYDMYHSFETGKAMRQYASTRSESRQSTSDDMTDEYIDYFIESVFAELEEEQAKPKPTMRRRLRNIWRKNRFS